MSPARSRCSRMRGVTLAALCPLLLAGCFSREEPVQEPVSPSPSPSPSASVDPAEALAGSVDTAPGEPSWCGPGVSSMVNILTLESLDSPETLETIPAEIVRLRAISRLEGVPSEVSSFLLDAADFGELVVEKEGQGLQVGMGALSLLSSSREAQAVAEEECPETYATGSSRLG